MKQRKRGWTWEKNTALGLVALLLTVSWLRCPELLADALRDGLSLCANTMIPALFPFMVLSELIVSSGVGRRLGRTFGGVIGPPLGLTESGACAWVMGLVCGFPVGARVAASLYRAGEMDAREFCHVICFCHVPSSAFLVGVVGSSLLGSSRLGWWLVVWTTVASLAVGLLFGRRGAVTRRAFSPLPADVSPNKGLLGRAIGSGCTSMLGVCATVLIFCAMLSTLSRWVDACGGGALVKVAIFGVTELSAGVRAAAASGYGPWGAALCGAVAGWGGFSVHCQILSVCDGCPVPLARFYLCRVLQSLICFGGMALIACAV